METEKPIWLFIFIDKIDAHRDYVYCIRTLTTVKFQRDGKLGATPCTSILLDGGTCSQKTNLLQYTGENTFLP